MAKFAFRPEPRDAETKNAVIMADDKAQDRIGKHDAGQLKRWHRNAAPEQEVRKTAKARTGSGAVPGNQNSLRHGIYADRCRRMAAGLRRLGFDAPVPEAGFFLFPGLPPRLRDAAGGDVTLTERLLVERTIVVPGTAFGVLVGNLGDCVNQRLGERDRLVNLLFEVEP